MQTKQILRKFLPTVAPLAILATLNGQSLTTIYSFGDNELGYGPAAGVTVGAGGELYGTVAHGGASGLGLVYELGPPQTPGGAWNETVLHSLRSQNGNGGPTGVTIGPEGMLYAAAGQLSNGGTVFRLVPPTADTTPWPEQLLWAFTDPTTDGSGPACAPVFGLGQALYGTTSTGGVNTSGVVYRIVPPTVQGGEWTEQMLFDFTGSDGIEPVGPIAIDSAGTIYGTTYVGGPQAGVVFRLAPPAQPDGDWIESTLYSFGSQSGDFGAPNGVVLGPNGVLYGTQLGGPRCDTAGCGVVYQLSPPETPGGAWVETILYTFVGQATGDGAQPNSTPVIAPGGVLYGTTSGGGKGYGTVYKLQPPSSPGGSWTEVVLYSFTGGADGMDPAGVTQGIDGNLYGTTQMVFSKDGVLSYGTVFELALQ